MQIIPVLFDAELKFLINTFEFVSASRTHFLNLGSN